MLKRMRSMVRSKSEGAVTWEGKAETRRAGGGHWSPKQGRKGLSMSSMTAFQSVLTPRVWKVGFVTCKNLHSREGHHPQNVRAWESLGQTTADFRCECISPIPSYTPFKEHENYPPQYYCSLLRAQNGNTGMLNTVLFLSSDRALWVLQHRAIVSAPRTEKINKNFI